MTFVPNTNFKCTYHSKIKKIFLVAYSLFFYYISHLEVRSFKMKESSLLRDNSNPN